MKSPLQNFVHYDVQLLLFAQSTFDETTRFQKSKLCIMNRIRHLEWLVVRPEHNVRDLP
jgi:hypothetical protein